MRFGTRAVGHNPLDTFLSKLSDECLLSDHYTNHCIRVLGITNFKRNQFSDRQVMAVSGHKNLQSLALYTRVRDDKKLMMGMKLTYSLLKPEEARVLRATNEDQDDPEGNTEGPPPKKFKSIEPVPLNTV